ncbi:hypothetical protein HanRHA438_Chr16g0751991 [Helianthus annuus]|nr:hypothetical protein HanIR_Chr16g0804401 [Helianthus annuus]KAJ0835164.1 hypothetical protein HanRHA438_Chr16g0751991 [Helianthus annuus]
MMIFAIADDVRFIFGYILVQVSRHKSAQYGSTRSVTGAGCFGSFQGFVVIRVLVRFGSARCVFRFGLRFMFMFGSDVESAGRSSVVVTGETRKTPPPSETGKTTEIPSVET